MGASSHHHLLSPTFFFFMPLPLCPASYRLCLASLARRACKVPSLPSVPLLPLHLLSACAASSHLLSSLCSLRLLPAAARCIFTHASLPCQGWHPPPLSFTHSSKKFTSLPSDFNLLGANFPDSLHFLLLLWSDILLSSSSTSFCTLRSR